MEKISRQEIKQRIQQLQAALSKEQVAAACIMQNVDLFYFSATMQPAVLLVPVSGEPVLFSRKNLERTRKETLLTNVLEWPGFKDFARMLPVRGRLGVEVDVMPAGLYLRLRQYLPADVELVDISIPIRRVRSVKSGYETGLMKEAAILIDQVFAEIPSLLQVGKCEYRLAAELEFQLRCRGHQGICRMRGFNNEMFYGHVLSGASGAVSSNIDSPTGGWGLSPAQPQGASRKKLLAGEPISIDIGGPFLGYGVDQTRVYAIDYLPEHLNRAYDISLEIEKEITRRCRPGVSCGDLYQLAVQMAEDAGLGNNFMGYGPGRVPYVGHGLGLEYDELPLFARGSTDILAAGNVFALEPKFIFPGEGVVGIENTWVVTSGGAERISLTPVELKVV